LRRILEFYIFSSTRR